MIGNHDLTEDEEPVLKVTDRRKFNPDGSVRDGVVLDPEPEAPEPAKEPSGVIAPPDADIPASEEAIPESEASLEDLDFDDENPASFINFLSTLVTNAAASLGAIPHPVTGQKSIDLDTGKYWVDVLRMLREKTKNNLASREKHLLESVLSDLQLQYVSLAKAAEEKLKAQAASKFSSKDILGK